LFPYETAGKKGSPKHGHQNPNPYAGHIYLIFASIGLGLSSHKRYRRSRKRSISDRAADSIAHECGQWIWLEELLTEQDECCVVLTGAEPTREAIPSVSIRE
jgi:hypothetical protein